MRRRGSCGAASGAAAAAVLALWLAAVLLTTQPAAADDSAPPLRCAPGWGLKNFDLFGFLGGILGGGGEAEPRCQPCGAWEASAGGAGAVCELCIPLLSSPNSFNTECECLPGTYLAGPLGNSTVAKDCVQCGPTAVSDARNAPSCHQCPVGTTAGSNNRCSCPAGSRATGIDEHGATGCEVCPGESVSPGGQSTSCETCTNSSIPTADRSYCGCPPGTHITSTDPLVCEACKSVFEYTAAPNRLLMCQQCFPFSYANADHTGCECAGGYYAASWREGGPVVCKRCPAGTVKAEPGNGDVSACVACPEGLEPSGSGKQCVTPLCPPGMEQAPDGSCRLCDESHFNHMRNGTCQPCGNNTLASPDRVRCDACKHGYLQTSVSGETLACMACMYGWTWNPQTLSCDEDMRQLREPHIPVIPDGWAHAGMAPAPPAPAGAPSVVTAPAVVKLPAPSVAAGGALQAKVLGVQRDGGADGAAGAGSGAGASAPQPGGSADWPGAARRPSAMGTGGRFGALQSRTRDNGPISLPEEVDDGSRRRHRLT